MSKTNWHVVAGPKGGWSVRHSGAQRASGVFSTQAAAVKDAQRLAKKEKADLYIHGKDGTVRERITYDRNS